MKPVRILGPFLAVALVSAALLTSAHAAPPEGKNPTYNTMLSGVLEVPPVTTDARGMAVVWVDGDSLRYRVTVNGMQNVTMAHIHLGAEDTNGPVVATLFHPDQPTGAVNGVLATGTITASDLVGPMAGKTIADLVAEINIDSTYVNVHTTEHPSGEIRGTLRPASEGVGRSMKGENVNGSGGAQAGTKAEVKPETGSPANPAAGSGTKAKAGSKPETGSGTKAKAETKPETGSGTKENDSSGHR